MSARLKVEGHTHLVREVSSSGIINTNTTEYELYMKRIRARARGRADRIEKKTCHINLKLSN